MKNGNKKIKNKNKKPEHKFSRKGSEKIPRKEKIEKEESEKVLTIKG